MLKAIDTVYNGYRFRSRLEARHAVYFDHINIRYEYEPQGFDLGDGIAYLPDFWIPDSRMWIEVKGQAPSQNEREKAIRLLKASKCPVVIVAGSFGCMMSYTSFFFDPFDSQEEFSEGDQFFVARCSRCCTTYFHTDTMFSRVVSCRSSCTRGMSDGQYLRWMGVLDDDDPGLQGEVSDACMAAQQARFEHGERGGQ